MRLRMLKTVRGAADGVSLKDYVEGSEHEIGGNFRADDLAQAFINASYAVEVKPEAKKPPAPPPSPPKLPAKDEKPPEQPPAPVADAAPTAPPAPAAPKADKPVQPKNKNAGK